MSKELLIVADTETTGLRIREDRVCQIGIVAAFIDREARDVTYFVITDELCRPDDLVIPFEASNIHGVTNEMVHDKPADYIVIAEAWGKTMGIVLQFLEETPDGEVALAGFNSDNFDWPLLSNIHPPIKDAFVDPEVLRIDALVMARRFYKGMSHKLTAMYEHLFQEEAVDAHNAAADCIMTARVLARMMCDNDSMSIPAAAAFTSKVMVLDEVPFGKHKGKRCDEVPITYFRWCKNNMTDMSPDWLATVNHQLKMREK